MKNRSGNIFIALALLALLTLNLPLSSAHAQGTAFTYQGQLQNNGGLASGTYNLQFSLYDTNASGTPIAEPVTNNAVVVTNGLFTVTIDFGSTVWNGQTNWLQIGVESNGISSFTSLSPRQQLTPVPYAIFAESSSNLSGTVSASELTSIGNTNGGYLYNFFVGPSGNSTMSGSGNTANGAYSLIYNTSGSDNTANGVNALFSNTSGSENTANGAVALFSNTSGSANTVNGVFALYSNTNGSYNVADGLQALYSNTSGQNNVAEGYFALGDSTNDNDLVAIGYEALQNDNAYPNVFTFSGNGENTAVGFQALQLDTSGVGNTAVGFQSLQLTTIGKGNTAIGDSTLYSNTNGSFNTANGYFALIDNKSGSYNTAIGDAALENNISGSLNTAIGNVALWSNMSGSSNTAVGFDALQLNTSGSVNIALGYTAGQNLQSGNNNIYIGNTGMTSESGIVRIGQPGIQTATYLAGNVSIGGVSPQQELSIDGGMDVDAGASDNGTVDNNWTLIFGGAGGGEGIGSVRVADYGDSYGLNFYTDYNKRMTILQNGHVGIGTTNATQLLVVGTGGAYCNGSTWVNTSDRNSKQDFAAIQPAEVLQKISTMPITEWQYKIDPAGVKHIGPMAQDFYAAFGLNGTDDKHISTVDEGGVALAAIQGLNEKVNEKDAEIQDLKQRLDALEKIVLKEKSN